MSSHAPNSHLPIDPSITSPQRSRPSAAPSIADGGHSSKHRQHVHRPHIKQRDKEKDEKALHITNSNLQQTLSPTEVETARSRSENPTPAQSRTTSRRTSLLGVSADQEGMAPGWRPERKGSKEAELTQEREKGLLRAAELRNELGDLNTHSNNTIRRLDNTYYSVLEKLGSLQNTITSLKELSVMTRRLDEEFETEGDKVAKEVGDSLDALQNFEAQRKRIEELAGRVISGREKVKLLGGRVDKVRERVEGWERAEEEWQDRTRKRLRVLWIVMSVTAALMVVLSVFHYTPAMMPGQGMLPQLNASEVLGSVSELESLRNGTWSPKKTAMDLVGNTSNCPLNEGELAEDPRLRLFDEL